MFFFFFFQPQHRLTKLYSTYHEVTAKINKTSTYYEVTARKSTIYLQKEFNHLVLP